MKTTQPILKLTAVSLLIAFAVGCAKQNSSEAPPPPAVVPEVPPADTRSNTGILNLAAGGAWANFNPDMAVFPTYVATHPLNAPTNFKINLNVSDIGDNRYQGSVIIAYNDNNTTYWGKFDTGTGTVQVSYKDRDTGKSVAHFNKWFTYDNKPVFHGFFQDQWGAIVFVVDNGLDLGDGGGITNLSGSIWFKNFQVSQAYQSPERCWFIRIGPYDCRTFLVGSEISTTSALYPSNGYQKLGTFNGLDRSTGFNQ